MFRTKLRKLTVAGLARERVWPEPRLSRDLPHRTNEPVDPRARKARSGRAKVTDPTRGPKPSGPGNADIRPSVLEGLINIVLPGTSRSRVLCSVRLTKYLAHDAARRGPMIPRGFPRRLASKLCVRGGL